jgi:hypothetical protein
MRDGCRRHNLVVPISCCLSATGVRFLGLPVPPRGSAFLAIGLPSTTTDVRDLDGVSMFRTNEIRVGSGAPFTPGPAVLTQLTKTHQLPLSLLRD